MTVGYIAVQFHEGADSDSADVTDPVRAGWRPTGRRPPSPQEDEPTFSQTGFPNYVTWDPTGEKSFTQRDGGSGYEYDKDVPTNCWGELKNFTFGVDRDYGGLNSSGGPQQSGRAEHRMLTITRRSDLISPELFKRCCNGFQLRRVVIVDPTYEYVTNEGNGRGLWVVADSCHVVSYQFISKRNTVAAYDIDFSTPESGNLPNLPTDLKGTAETKGAGGIQRDERVEILYTKVAMRIGTWSTAFVGWDTGAEQKWDGRDVGVDSSPTSNANTG